VQRLDVQRSLAAPVKGLAQADVEFGMRRAAGHLAGFLFDQVVEDLGPDFGVFAMNLQRPDQVVDSSS